MSSIRSLRLAVLIDAENTSATIASALFEEIARFGEASVRRAYGDFTSGNLAPWSKQLARHGIIPQQQFAYTKQKNSSDIALVIDAMDLLHSGRFDGFCLVSSDSDFTRLASRLRENVEVYGFGERKTPESFRQACKQFIYTENLIPADKPSTASATKLEGALLASKAIPAIRSAIRQMEGEDGSFDLATLGSLMRKLEPDFDQRTYGCAKLSALVEKTGAFVVSTSKDGTMRISEKNAPKGAQAKKAS